MVLLYVYYDGFLSFQVESGESVVIVNTQNKTVYMYKHRCKGDEESKQILYEEPRHLWIRELVALFDTLQVDY